MPVLGSGRYTVYVPNASERNKRLAKMFNENSPNGLGEIYGAAYQTDPKAAAEAAVKVATGEVNAAGVGGMLPTNGKQAGDINMFPNGVLIGYGGSPNFEDVKWKNPGDPANPFVPDLSSPGAGKTSPLDKGKDPGISIDDVKPGYQPGAPGTGTTSPVAMSKVVSAPIGKNLELGKSPG